MAIDWSHLPRELWSQVCMCGAKNGFTLIPETGWWVCANCKNPTITAAVFECDLCAKVFVPKFFKKAKYAQFGIACDECESPTAA